MEISSKGKGIATAKGEVSVSSSAAQAYVVQTLGRSSTAAQLPPATDIEKWDTKKIIQHLQETFPGELLQEDFDILIAQRIGGHSFLTLTKDDLMADEMKRGPASVIAGHVEKLKADQAKSSEIDPIQTFHIIVKPKTTTMFAWDVNTNECTINDLKNYITVSYPEMTKEAENARVVIFVDKESRIMVDDTHLRTTLKAFAKSGIEKFTVTFQTPKKAYNKWSIKEVLTDVLNSELTEYTQLPDLDIEKLLRDNPITFTDPQKAHFIQTLKNIFEAFNGNIHNNEATSRNFINPFMIAAVLIINKLFGRRLLDLVVEYNLDGSLGFGKVDYAFLFLIYAILVTEAKALEIPQGIAQNLVQLHTASEKLKRKRDNTPALPAVYGIVSTGRTWRFICWDTSPGKPAVQLSKEYICRFEGEMQDEMKVLQIISTILWIQATELVTRVKRGEIESDEPEVAKRIRMSDSSSA